MASHDITAAAPGPLTGLDDHIYNRLLKERIIFLGSDVRDDNANAICAQMLLLAAEDPEKDIWLYINSPGGSVTAGMAIFDTMQWVPNDVATVAMGMVYIACTRYSALYTAPKVSVTTVSAYLRLALR